MIFPARNLHLFQGFSMATLNNQRVMEYGVFIDIGSLKIPYSASIWGADHRNAILFLTAAPQEPGTHCHYRMGPHSYVNVGL